LLSISDNNGLALVSCFDNNRAMATSRQELLQGTLDLLILKTLATADLHGWDIAKRVAVASRHRLTLKQGSLYPALHRLENRGWIDAEWGISDGGRAAKFYRLTRPGRKQLVEEKEYWLGFAAAMTSVLDLKEAP
jgi:transcriptional regulator